jgi:hypothetical protein
MAVIVQGQRMTHHDNTRLNRKIDESAHHHEQTNIERMVMQRGKVNKKKDKKNRRNQKEPKNRDYYRDKGRESENTCEVWNNLSNQNKSYS